MKPWPPCATALFGHPKVVDELNKGEKCQDLIADCSFDNYSLGIVLYILLADDNRDFLKALESAESKLQHKDKYNLITAAVKRNPKLDIIKSLVDGESNAG